MQWVLCHRFGAVYTMTFSACAPKAFKAVLHPTRQTADDNVSVPCMTALDIVDTGTSQCLAKPNKA